MCPSFSRRGFLKGAALAGAAAFTPELSMAQQQQSQGAQVPKRPLGKTGVQVSALGVGGYHLGSAKSTDEANRIVAEALDAGINFFDNAWEYHKGESEARLGEALKGKREQAFVMTKV